MVVLRLVIAGYYPNQHFIITDQGQVLACLEAREFLKQTRAWIPDLAGSHS
ncbi:MAG: hypothetical protein VKK04_10245 [Synechococcales bacterium]|nr:hypothetical protein [Synechococcales bacterium]